MVMPLCLWQVGDRPFTDVVYGNRNGFLTILTEPLSLAGEPFVVRQVGHCYFHFLNSLFHSSFYYPCIGDKWCFNPMPERESSSSYYPLLIPPLAFKH